MRPGVTEILKLGSNENQLGTSPKALEAMAAAISSANVYPDPGLMELRKKLGGRLGFAEEPEKHVVMAAGSSVSTLLLGEVFINPGDEMVQCEPTFGAMAGAVRRYGGKVVSLPLTANQEFDLPAMKAAITDKTKFVYVCNPNNPTGTTIDPEELRAFLKSLPEHVLAVVDEAYIDFCDDPQSEEMISEIYDGSRVIILRTFSKLYGLAGMRIGYTVASREICSFLQRATTFFPLSRPAAAAALAALDDEDFVKLSRETAAAGREYLTAELKKLGAVVYPSQANFIYADTGYNTAQLAQVTKEQGLIIRGNFPYSRITVGTERQNRRVIEIIKDAIGSGRVDKAAGQA
jgi:histidinol-phosphate aminotransferase